MMEGGHNSRREAIDHVLGYTDLALYALAIIVGTGYVVGTWAAYLKKEPIKTAKPWDLPK